MTTETLPAGEIVDAEAVTPRGMIRHVDSGVTLFGTNDPTVVIDRATSISVALKRVCTQQHLVATISGREHPLVEAWTLLGSMLSVYPVVQWTRPLIVDGRVVGYEARVEAVTRDGAVVGAAESMCTRSEATWHERDDYALRGMAQTRATSRALRGPLDFIMKLAGYATTPAEEMPPDGTTPAPPQTRKAAGQSKAWEFVPILIDGNPVTCPTCEDALQMAYGEKGKSFVAHKTLVKDGDKCAHKFHPADKTLWSTLAPNPRETASVPAEPGLNTLRDRVAAAIGLADPAHKTAAFKAGGYHGGTISPMDWLRTASTQPECEAMLVALNGPA